MEMNDHRARSGENKMRADLKVKGNGSKQQSRRLTSGLN